MKGEYVMKIDKGIVLGGLGLLLTGISYVVNIASSNHQTKVLKQEITKDVLNTINNQK